MKKFNATLEEIIDTFKKDLKYTSLEIYHYEFDKKSLEKFVKDIEELQKPSVIEKMVDDLRNIKFVKEPFESHATITMEFNFDLLKEYGNYNTIYEIERSKEELLKPYQKRKIRLSQFEYDLIETNDQPHDRKFGAFKTYQHMIKKGHFKGVYDTEMTLEEILDNCEVVNEEI